MSHALGVLGFWYCGTAMQVLRPPAGAGPARRKLMGAHVKTVACKRSAAGEPHTGVCPRLGVLERGGHACALRWPAGKPPWTPAGNRQLAASQRKGGRGMLYIVSRVRWV
ncbi:MAG: hypothetical protein J3K34DRAFT_421496, partial [Monoraphidium minutum]